MKLLKKMPLMRNSFLNQLRCDSWFNAVVVLLGCFCMAAANSKEDPIESLLYPYKQSQIEFSGAWVKDYLRSEDWETVLINQINQLRRDAEREAARGGDLRVRQTPTIDLSRRSRRGNANIVDLARFTETITRHHIMRISVVNESIRIERDGEPTLICGLDNAVVESFSSNFGTEVCGWDNLQLLFRISLPEGVNILQRITLSPDAQSINIITRVSDQGATPFTLVEFYERFDDPEADFDCTQTLSRGRVCKRVAAPQ